jgi:hypothetical protein
MPLQKSLYCTLRNSFCMWWLLAFNDFMFLDTHYFYDFQNAFHYVVTIKIYTGYKLIEQKSEQKYARINLDTTGCHGLSTFIIEGKKNTPWS